MNQSLYWAILEDPWDDARRLVYADYLEETGDLERAYGVRNGVKYPNGRTGHNRMHPVHRYYTFPRDPLTDWGRSDRLPDYCEAGSDHRGFLDSVELPMKVFLERAGEIFSSYPITMVYLSDRKPREFNAGEWGWRSGWPLDVDEPDLIYEPLDGDWANAPWPDPWEAKIALSWECVDYGRKKAGLPKLERRCAS